MRALKNAALLAFSLLRRVRDRGDPVQFVEADACMGMIEAALAECAPGVACHGWTPVSERLPDDGVVVLVRVAGTPIDNPSPWVGSGHYVRDEFADVMRWEVAGTFGWGSPVKVTHWKPLDADVARPAEDFVVSVRHLVFQARTSGGTAGRDEGLCAALDRVEALLPPPQIEPSPVALPSRVSPPPSELEALTVERDNLRRALSFYAEREHYAFDGEPDDWEAASGEPQNWLCAPTIPPHDKDFDPAWMIEDGGIARAALAGEYVEQSNVGEQK